MLRGILTSTNVLSKKIQVCQNKCIRFCLRLNNTDHVGIKEFREINWLPTKERFEQCVCANIFKFFNNMSPTYTSELYQPFNHGHNTRRSNCRLQLPYRNTSYGHKALSFLGPKLWNNLPAKIKSSSNINTFKHDIKKLFFEELQRKTTVFIFKDFSLPDLFQISEWPFPGNCSM